MREVRHFREDVGGAREEILNLIQRNTNNNIVIYFDGWQGFAAALVLRSIAQELPSMKAPPPELRFGRTIYVDCSRCTSKRAMQKEIAQELRLDRQTMAMFDEQDREDDFSGVDLVSRDAIRGVAAVIDRNLRESRFMMIFINGSDDEVVLGKLGIPENSDCVILWTFSTRLVTMRDRSREIAEKLRYTDVFLVTYRDARYISTSQFTPLFREEAANIVARNASMRGMGVARVLDCCLYGLLVMHHSFGSTTGFPWPAHAPNFWICDGIIPSGGRAREISNALHSEISFECNTGVFDGVLRMLKNDSRAPFLVLDRSGDNYEKRPYRWLSVTFLRNRRAQEEMRETVLAGASSVFLAFEREHNPIGLPNGFFKQCRNLGVLVLSCCAFSFASPPFLHCHTLRFLGLDHCTDNSNAVELGGGWDCATSSSRWAFLKSVWVIDLYYTHWVEILSEEKIQLMANLMELNIEGVRWPPWTSNHHLPNLQRLRIIRPTYDEASSAETPSSDSFLMDNTSLEILDLSGSKRVMLGGRDLAASISKASHLQVLILDGCDGLGDVVLPNNSSLRSFSFDGYGPASSHRTSTVELPSLVSRPQHPPTEDSSDNKKDIAKTSIVSLQGCRRLDKLFLRGLPNLVELDLSGCAIKVLDFEAMVVDVPMLKRLFLLGCERLCAIKWSYGKKSSNLRVMDMICIDTRPGSGRVPGYAQRPPSLGSHQESYWVPVQVHATAADARLARSLWAPVHLAPYNFFNIRITSSVEPADEATTSKETMIGSDDQRQHCLLYSDVFANVGDGLAPMVAFPQPPTRQTDRHIEIGVGSRSVQSETEEILQINNLASLMSHYTESLHVHHVSTCTSTMPAARWYSLRWCRVERCPGLQFVFPPAAVDCYGRLENIWVSDLLMARCIWSKGEVLSHDHFYGLQHLHLRRCLSLRFALAVGWRLSFPSLETLHVIHCGDLRHVFVPATDKDAQHTSVEFPKLTTIHLHDLPALQQISEAPEMMAPALETIKIRGCWSLRRLPALKGRNRNLDMKKPTVEVEKDVWDKLEWDGVDAGHHPSLYETPVHSRHYKQSRLLRGTVLR
ncbi:unnamed protein product [Urochloa decumbens]|uniref:Disease resistance protein At4g27190-like leucine-rich repeats domain-containing protein n=1 Tax=Urochloa decumbens TaxID=240449 RepID=A0ABC9BVC8_9POAL